MMNQPFFNVEKKLSATALSAAPCGRSCSAGCHARQHAAVGRRVVLDTSIGMVNQPSTRMSVLNRHGQCAKMEFLPWSMIHGPADNLARKQINQNSEMQPAFTRADERMSPDQIRSGRAAIKRRCSRSGAGGAILWCSTVVR